MGRAAWNPCSNMWYWSALAPSHSYLKSPQSCLSHGSTRIKACQRSTESVAKILDTPHPQLSSCPQLPPDFTIPYNHVSSGHSWHTSALGNLPSHTQAVDLSSGNLSNHTHPYLYKPAWKQFSLTSGKQLVRLFRLSWLLPWLLLDGCCSDSSFLPWFLVSALTPDSCSLLVLHQPRLPPASSACLPALIPVFMSISFLVP